MKRAIEACAALLTLASLPACGGHSNEPSRASSQRDSTGPSAAIDWSMSNADEFDPTQMVREPVPPAEHRLDERWDVELSGCASTPPTGVYDPIVDYAWDVALPTGNLHVDAGSTCYRFVPFPSQGTYKVDLTVTTQSGQVATASRYVKVRDILVVSIGDSVASGEGDPDSLPSESAAEDNPPALPARWADARCHRSHWAGPAQAAYYLEGLDRHYAVTFLSVACSGASVASGLVGSYGGIENPHNDAPFAPQLQQVASLLCPRPDGACTRDELRNIDVLLIQAGANDIGFSDIVKTCASPIGDCANDSGFTSSVAAKIAGLPEQYASLNRALHQTLRYSSAYIGEYFDPTHGPDGNYCDMVLGDAATDMYPIVTPITDPTGLSDGEITPDESQWAHDAVIAPLNAAVQSAAAAYGWNYVGGIDDAFARYGYCARIDQRWVRTYDESKRDQGNMFGTMHPNIYGQGAYASALYSAMLPVTASPHATAVWIPAVQPQTRGFDLSPSDAQSQTATLATQGIRVKLLVPHVVDHDQVRYDMVWEPGSQPQLFLFGADASTVTNASRTLWDDGWRLVILNSFVLPGDDLRYNAVWEQGGTDQRVVYGYLYDDYRSLYDQLWDQGWRLKGLTSAVLSGDRVVYNAVWEPSTDPEIQVYGYAYADYRSTYDQLWNQGWRLKSLDTAVLSNEQVLYNAVWKPSDSAETQAYEWREEDLQTQDDVLEPQGWGLELLTASVTH